MADNTKVKFFDIKIDMEEEIRGRWKNEPKFPFILIQAGSGFSFMRVCYNLMGTHLS